MPFYLNSKAAAQSSMSKTTASTAFDIQKRKVTRKKMFDQASYFSKSNNIEAGSHTIIDN